MELAQLKNIIEAVLLTADHPMDLRKLEAIFEADEENRPAREQILQALQQLQEDYQGRGVELKEVASGYRMQVIPDCAEWVSRMWEEKAPRYSRALLETLVLIAYRQPITRGEIEEIRGVSVSSHIVKTLSEREWVRVLGHKDVPGKPAMYGTTREFLDYFNLKSLDDLPNLAELKDLDKLHPELAFEQDVAADAANDAQGDGADTAADEANAQAAAEMDSDASDMSSNEIVDELGDEIVDESGDEASDGTSGETSDESGDPVDPPENDEAQATAQADIADDDSQSAQISAHPATQASTQTSTWAAENTQQDEPLNEEDTAEPAAENQPTEDQSPLEEIK